MEIYFATKLFYLQCILNLLDIVVFVVHGNCTSYRATTAARKRECYQTIKHMPILQVNPETEMTPSPRKIGDTNPSNNGSFRELGNYNETPVILPETHPLLERFQNSLQGHLKRVGDQILSEINELKADITSKQVEREDLGYKLYDYQEHIRKQRPFLQQYENQIHDTTEKRLRTEKNAGEYKISYDERLDLQKNGKEYRNQLLLDLNNIQILESNIENWANEVKKDVQTAKRTVSKDSQKQNIVFEEKKRADLLLLALSEEVRIRELELNSVKVQISEQECILDKVNKNLSDANTDLEAINREQKRLTKTWHEVILAVQHRDKLLLQMSKSLSQQINEYKTIEVNINATKKQSLKEMEINERLVSIKSKSEEDFRIFSKQIRRKRESISKCEENLAKMEQIFGQMQKDLESSTAERNVLEVKLRACQHFLDSTLNKRIDIEEQILLLTQEQITTDKASEYRMKKIREEQECRRTMEINLTRSENSLSNALLELERLRGLVGSSKKSFLKFQDEYRLVQTYYSKVKNERKEMEFSLNIKIKHIDNLVKKITNYTQFQGNSECSSEGQIYILEQNLNEIGQQVGVLRNSWLTLQGNVVDLSDKRLIQMDEIQLVREQVSVIKQKILRIDRDLDNLNIIAKETVRNIESTNSKLSLLGTNLFRKRKYREKETLETYQIRLDLLDRYRASELSLLSLERDLISLASEINCWKEEDIKVHREGLSWESKFKIVEEVIKMRNDEKYNDTEFETMHSEIHRMEIRYNQLKRAQYKLTQDLEHCVLHREQIFVKALQLERTQGLSEQFRSNIPHKFNEIKSKIKQCLIGVSHNEGMLADIKENYNKLSTSTTRLQEDIENEKLQDTLTQAEIEESILLKHKNLENIIRKQHRGKRYRGLVAMTNLPKWRNEILIESNKTKQYIINNNLSDIILILLNDFQDKKFYLSRILQTLRNYE